MPFFAIVAIVGDITNNSTFHGQMLLVITPTTA